MKDIRGAIRALLLGDATISGMVGGTRIHPGILPQGTAQTSNVPAIVQNLISEASDYHMQGASGLGSARVQVDCWAQTPDAAVLLAGLVFDRLSGHRGVVTYGSNSPQDEVEIKGIFHEQSRDDYDDVAKLHRRSRDYTVWFSQT
jgi:hypothetical protein